MVAKHNIRGCSTEGNKIESCYLLLPRVHITRKLEWKMDPGLEPRIDVRCSGCLTTLSSVPPVVSMLHGHILLCGLPLSLHACSASPWILPGLHSYDTWGPGKWLIIDPLVQFFSIKIYMIRIVKRSLRIYIF